MPHHPTCIVSHTPFGGGCGVSRRQFLAGAAAGAATLLLPGCASRDRGGAGGVSPLLPIELDVSRDDWHSLAEIALTRLRRAGVAYGDVRIVHLQTQLVRAVDDRIVAIDEETTLGVGVRATMGQAWGFAATADLSPESIRAAALQAIELARGQDDFAPDAAPLQLGEIAVIRDRVVTPRGTDPLETSIEVKAALLLNTTAALRDEARILSAGAHCWSQRERKLLKSTAGTEIHWDLCAVGADASATARVGDVTATRTLRVPTLRTGFERLAQADMAGQAPRIAAEAAEKAAAPVVAPGAYDLVLDGENLALTIHETCGHATELDRALGDDLNGAGGTFLTPDRRGGFRYGASCVNLIADNTATAQLASTGYDDEGVAAQRWPLVESGVFVGYSSDRTTAARVAGVSSRGCCRAHDHAALPIVRMPNIGLMAGDGSVDDLISEVRKGILIEGHDGYSIDDRRLSFAFGGDAAWLIENGRRRHMLRDAVYTGTTPQFWGSCDAIAGPAYRTEHGFTHCGKGQPLQLASMTHAASPARFRGIAVLAGDSPA